MDDASSAGAGVTTNVRAGQTKRVAKELPKKAATKIRGLADDVKDVYAEAKSRGYDTKTIRAIVRLRKMENHVREEAEALLETYKAALGLK